MSDSSNKTPLSKRRKRPQPPIYNGVGSTLNKDNDYLCPICFDVIEDALVTKCGHSFCCKCIERSLENSKQCPKCSFAIDDSQIFPNFSLNSLIRKYKAQQSEDKKMEFDLLGNNGLESIERNHLDLAQVNYLLETLEHKKQQLEKDHLIAENKVLLEFLEEMQKKKKEQLDELCREIKTVEADITVVQSRLKEAPASALTSRQLDETECSAVPNESTSKVETVEAVFNGCHSSRHWLYTTMAAKRKKLHQHFDDLEHCYFNLRRCATYPADMEEVKAVVSSVEHDEMKTEMSNSLNEFTENLSKFIKFTSVRLLANLSYASDIHNTSSIVSSIEFDRDSDYFAIAGVTKKIKIFEYGSVVRDTVDMHFPVHEMMCNSKISSVIWSPYYKSLLASSDYEGTVTMWDVSNGTKVSVLQEHEKRCWCVDFNSIDPKLLASGSDDTTVKLWHSDSKHSVASIETKANVCCVKFNPGSRFHLAFGSADHNVHYYDLRNKKVPVKVLKDHRKAVSYAKFLNSTELVSASTDSQLKLWDLAHSQSLRTFSGHTNEKNFVGLATNGDYIACGSENNSMYIYYKGLSKHLLTYRFSSNKGLLEKERKDEESNEFVSAVCWKPDSDVVIAANSQGAIKVLEMF